MQSASQREREDRARPLITHSLTCRVCENFPPGSAAAAIINARCSKYVGSVCNTHARLANIASGLGEPETHAHGKKHAKTILGFICIITIPCVSSAGRIVLFDTNTIIYIYTHRLHYITGRGLGGRLFHIYKYIHLHRITRASRCLLICNISSLRPRCPTRRRRPGRCDRGHAPARRRHHWPRWQRRH